MCNSIIYIRRVPNIPTVLFDIVEKVNGRFESKIHPFAVDYSFLLWMQRNGNTILDADFITHEMVVGN